MYQVYKFICLMVIVLLNLNLAKAETAKALLNSNEIAYYLLNTECKMQNFAYKQTLNTDKKLMAALVRGVSNFQLILNNYSEKSQPCVGAFSPICSTRTDETFDLTIRFIDTVNNNSIQMNFSDCKNSFKVLLN